MDPLVFIILDGWGLTPPSRGNAIVLANPKNFDSLWNNYPHTLLRAHGFNVGLPNEQDGNSEAGHLNLGGGRIVKQDSSYILEAIKDGTFFKNTAFLEAVKHLKKYQTKLHLIGLLTGKQSAHSSPDHLAGLLELVKQQNLSKVILHLFTDGRDSPQHGAINFLRELRKSFKNNEFIASISGRFYAMDRTKNWSRIEKIYNALVLGEGERAEDPEKAILQAYNRGETDEFIKPTVIVKNGKATATIEDNDVIIFFNSRSDRARQLTKVFVQPNFNELDSDSFIRKKFPQNIRFVAMTDFGPDLPYILTAFPSRDIINSLPFVLRNLRQVYIAETEKYSHVTYFFNGGYANPIAGEERIRIPSPICDCYAEKPEMSAYQIADEVIKKIKSKEYNFILLNFANPDMIGHTGDLKAGIKAAQVVDECLGKVIKETLKREGSAIITADHGNLEEMINLKTGEIDTEHSTNPVPFIIVNTKPEIKSLKLREGILGDVAPTVLDLLKIEKPIEMTGKTLIS